MSEKRALVKLRISSHKLMIEIEIGTDTIKLRKIIGIVLFVDLI